MPLHDLHRICRSFPAVDQHRKIMLTCKFKLTDKPFFLQTMRFMIPVIIQSNLADSNNLFLIQKRFHPYKFLFVQRTDFIRMYADCGIHKRIFFHHFCHTCTGLISCRHIDDRADTIFFHRHQQFFSVYVKLLIIIVRMRIKNHHLTVTLF